MARRAGSADAPALVATLVAAYDEDPLWRWLAPEAGARAALLRDVFAVVAEAGLARGSVVVDGDACDAVVVWTGPGVDLIADAGAERYLALLEAHVGARVEDLVAGMAALERHRPPEPHRTVHVVAVRRGARGRGLGGELLGHALAEGGPVYLDTTDERNVAFYRRHGFAVVAAEPLGGGGPVMRALVRA